MLVKEVIQGFRDVIADPTSKISDETSYSDRLLYHYLKMSRASLLYRKFIEKNSPINKFSTQTLECVKLIEVPTSECPCKPLDKCTYLRTEKPLPQTLLITDVRAGSISDMVEASEDFNYIKWEEVEDLHNSRFAFEKKERFYSLKTKREGTYLYVHNRRILEIIDIEGLYEDPIEVYMHNGCSKNNCVDSLESRFPFDSELLTPLYQMTYEKIISIKSASGQPDRINDDEAKQG